MRQTFFLLIAALIAVSSCAKEEEIEIIPPATYPLSRNLIGYGVVNTNYTHIVRTPETGSESSGFLRGGSIVSVLERRPVKTGETYENWVLVSGQYEGWLREESVRIFDRAEKAKTASESMP
jgi:hypothetical protein